MSQAMSMKIVQKRKKRRC